MANKLVSDIITMALDWLKLDATSIGVSGLESTRSITWISDLDKQFFHEFYGKRITLPDYLSSHYGFDAQAGTTLALATAAGATTLTLTDTTNASLKAGPGAGVIYENNQFDIFTYTLNTAGVLTGIPATGPGALNFAHTALRPVEQVYSLPSDFGRMRPIHKHNMTNQDHDGVTIDGSGYFETPQMPQTTTFSTVIINGTTYLWIPQGLSSNEVGVYYDMAPSSITTVGSSISWPDPFHWYHVWGLIAIYRQILDEEYVPQKEQAAMDKVALQAMAKRSAGKRIMAGNQFFGRYRNNSNFAPWR